MSPFLRIVAGVLLLWEPLNFAAMALDVAPTLAYRGGIAVAELVVHGIIAASCVGAGMMLLNQSPDGRRMARIAVVFSVGRVLYAAYWSALPRNITPGTELFHCAIAVIVGVLMLLVLREPTARPFR